MLAGQRMVGNSWSSTVTVKVQALVLPLASVAVQVTVVTPLLKLLPLAGTQLTVAPGQLSVVLAAKATFVAQVPAAVRATMFAGQTTAGASWSWTVTVKLQEAVLPLA